MYLVHSSLQPHYLVLSLVAQQARTVRVAAWPLLTQGLPCCQGQRMRWPSSTHSWEPNSSNPEWWGFRTDGVFKSQTTNLDIGHQPSKGVWFDAHWLDQWSIEWATGVYLSRLLPNWWVDEQYIQRHVFCCQYTSCRPCAWQQQCAKSKESCLYATHCIVFVRMYKLIFFPTPCCCSEELMES